MNITGKVLRVLPVRDLKTVDGTKKMVDLVIADAFDYHRVSLWDENAALVLRGDIKPGDVLRIENASVPREDSKGNAKRANAGRYTKINRISMSIAALSHAPPVHLTVLAVARPEKGQVCIAGIDETGEWIRAQGIYENDIFDSTGGLNFKNFGITKIYVDEWRGRRPRREDRFFVYCEGMDRVLTGEEKRAFLERNVDESVHSVFKDGRSLGLIKPRILQVYEEQVRKRTGQKSHEVYIRFNFRDYSGRTYRRWSCRCDAFYKAWNDLKERHRWTYGWRMHRYLKKHDTYFAIGLTYSDYGIARLEYGAYPMIVGVHVV
ncbi:MAG: SOSS complex subunit B family protein [Halobacteriota archaeon]